MMKPLGMAPFMMVASPAYLRKAGVLKLPTDLKQHQIVGYANHGGAFEWTYQGPKGVQGHMRAECALRTNSAEMMREAVVQGLGVAMLPKFMVQPLIDEGVLAQVLPEYLCVPLRQVVALTPPTRHRTAKVQAFLTHLSSLPKFG
jgi:DNA-binding transcriptional LysR family regulator